MMNSRRDCLRILQLREGAKEEEIKKAYYRLALKHHPDKNPDRKKEAEEKFKKINYAYNFLISSKEPEGFEEMKDVFDFFDAQMKDIERELNRFSQEMEMHFSSIEGSLLEINETVERMKYLFGYGLLDTFIELYKRRKNKSLKIDKKPDETSDIPVLQMEQNPDKGTLHLVIESLNEQQIRRIDSILMRFLKKGFVKREEKDEKIRYVGYPYLFPLKWHYALFEFDAAKPHLYVHLPKDKFEVFVSSLEKEFFLSKKLAVA